VARSARSLLRKAAAGEPSAALIDAGLLSIGSHSYQRPLVRVWGSPAELVEQGMTVTIGSFSSLGPGVEIFVDSDHRTDWVTTFPIRTRLGLEGAWHDGTPFARGPVTIGSDVWIGAHSLILSGVTIGDGAVVAAGSVVSRDVRPYAIAAGIPATERKRRFADDTVERLLDIRWWEWPTERIVDVVDLLCSDNIDAFLAYADRVSR
jgi:acetyltransferase-like isoleucine patch superfamily enzyme